MAPRTPSSPEAATTDERARPRRHSLHLTREENRDCWGGNKMNGDKDCMKECGSLLGRNVQVEIKGARFRGGSGVEANTLLGPKLEFLMSDFTV